MWFMVDDKSIKDRKQVIFEQGGITHLSQVPFI